MSVLKSSVKLDGDSKDSWKTLSLQDLETQYSPSKWSKRYSEEEIIRAHVRAVTERSLTSKSTIPNRLDISCGSGPRMKIDVFGEDLPEAACVFVFVHGGYWQEMSKEISSYVVQPLYNNGILTVIVGYDLAPQVTLEEIVAEVRTAVGWVCNLARKRGSKGVFLSGHSAGGHLIMEILSAGRDGESGGQAKHSDLIKGAIPISGVFDLRPLVNTYVNEPLKLNESSSWSLSPLSKINDLANLWPNLKLLVAVGQHDSPEFQRQSKQYFKECLEVGLKAKYIVVKEADHFNIVEDLAREDFSLTRRIIDFVKTVIV